MGLVVRIPDYCSNPHSLISALVIHLPRMYSNQASAMQNVNILASA